MRIGKAIIAALAVVGLASTAYAIGPSIGVYFDEEATLLSTEVAGGQGQLTTAYVFSSGVDCMVGGMTFAITMDDAYFIVGATYPDGVDIGNPKNGVAIGFRDCLPGQNGAPVMGAILTIYNGTSLVTDGEIRVVTNPREGGIFIADCDGVLIPADGLTSYMSVVVDNEGVTWGQMKQLYR